MTAVSPHMHRQIRAQLKDIAKAEDVTVLFAIESGSRAWGFHSPDSDYDVRFVYARPPDWHYALGKKRDVIERPIDDVLDISGWELSKALTLSLGSNAVIAEWLQSPIVYEADAQAVARLTDFARRVLDRKSVTWHYLSLLRRQQSRLTGPMGGIRIKRYFYILRPTLALRWIRVNSAAMPPMDMAQLRQGCALPRDVSDALDTLTARKMAARERAEVTVAEPVLDGLVAHEVAAAEDWLKTAPKADTARFWTEANALHRELSPQ
jgi:predicted nucleotidyltransferase